MEKPKQGLNNLTDAEDVYTKGAQDRVQEWINISKKKIKVTLKPQKTPETTQPTSTGQETIQSEDKHKHLETSENTKSDTSNITSQESKPATVVRSDHLAIPPALKDLMRPIQNKAHLPIPPPIEEVIVPYKPPEPSPEKSDESSNQAPMVNPPQYHPTGESRHPVGHLALPIMLDQFLQRSHLMVPPEIKQGLGLPAVDFEGKPIQYTRTPGLGHPDPSLKSTLIPSTSPIVPAPGNYHPTPITAIGITHPHSTSSFAPHSVLPHQPEQSRTSVYPQIGHIPPHRQLENQPTHSISYASQQIVLPTVPPTAIPTTTQQPQFKAVPSTPPVNSDILNYYLPARTLENKTATAVKPVVTLAPTPSTLHGVPPFQQPPGIIVQSPSVTSQSPFHVIPGHQVLPVPGYPRPDSPVIQPSPIWHQPPPNHPQISQLTHQPQSLNLKTYPPISIHHSSNQTHQPQSAGIRHPVSSPITPYPTTTIAITTAQQHVGLNIPRNVNPIGFVPTTTGSGTRMVYPNPLRFHSQNIHTQPTEVAYRHPTPVMRYPSSTTTGPVGYQPNPQPVAAGVTGKKRPSDVFDWFADKIAPKKSNIIDLSKPPPAVPPVLSNPPSIYKNADSRGPYSEFSSYPTTTAAISTIPPTGHYLDGSSQHTGAGSLLPAPNTTPKAKDEDSNTSTTPSTDLNQHLKESVVKTHSVVQSIDNESGHNIPEIKEGNDLNATIDNNKTAITYSEMTKTSPTSNEIKTSKFTVGSIAPKPTGAGVISPSLGRKPAQKLPSSARHMKVSTAPTKATKLIVVKKKVTTPNTTAATKVITKPTDAVSQNSNNNAQSQPVKKIIRLIRTVPSTSTSTSAPINSKSPIKLPPQGAIRTSVQPAEDVGQKISVLGSSMPKQITMPDSLCKPFETGDATTISMDNRTESPKSSSNVEKVKTPTKIKSFPDDVDSSFSDTMDETSDDGKRYKTEYDIHTGTWKQIKIESPRKPKTVKSPTKRVQTGEHGESSYFDTVTGTWVERRAPTVDSDSEVWSDVFDNQGNTKSGVSSQKVFNPKTGTWESETSLGLKRRNSRSSRSPDRKRSNRYSRSPGRSKSRSPDRKRGGRYSRSPRRNSPDRRYSPSRRSRRHSPNRERSRQSSYSPQRRRNRSRSYSPKRRHKYSPDRDRYRRYSPKRKSSRDRDSKDFRRSTSRESPSRKSQGKRKDSPSKHSSHSPSRDRSRRSSPSSSVHSQERDRDQTERKRARYNVDEKRKDLGDRNPVEYNVTRRLFISSEKDVVLKNEDYDTLRQSSVVEKTCSDPPASIQEMKSVVVTKSGSQRIILTLPSPQKSYDPSTPSPRKDMNISGSSGSSSTPSKLDAKSIQDLAERRAKLQADLECLSDSSPEKNERGNSQNDGTFGNRLDVIRKNAHSSLSMGQGPTSGLRFIPDAKTSGILGTESEVESDVNLSPYKVIDRSEGLKKTGPSSQSRGGYASAAQQWSGQISESSDQSKQVERIKTVGSDKPVSEASFQELMTEAKQRITDHKNISLKGQNANVPITVGDWLKEEFNLKSQDLTDIKKKVNVDFFVRLDLLTKTGRRNMKKRLREQICVILIGTPNLQEWLVNKQQMMDREQEVKEVRSQVTKAEIQNKTQTANHPPKAKITATTVTGATNIPASEKDIETIENVSIIPTLKLCPSLTHFPLAKAKLQEELKCVTKELEDLWKQSESAKEEAAVNEFTEFCLTKGISQFEITLAHNLKNSGVEFLRQDLQLLEADIKIRISQYDYKGVNYHRLPMEILLRDEKQLHFTQTGLFLTLCNPLPPKTYNKLVLIRTEVDKKENAISFKQGKTNDLESQITSLKTERAKLLTSFTGNLNRKKLAKVRTKSRHLQRCFEFLKKAHGKQINEKFPYLKMMIADVERHIELMNRLKVSSVQ